MKGGTIAISWGKNGGFYFAHIKQTNLKARWIRICLGRVAITYISRDLDHVLSSALEARPR